MKFADKLLGLLKQGFTYVGQIIQNVLEFIALPLSYLFYFFEGVFYFIGKLFEVLLLVLSIFIAIFQFMFAIAAGVLRTLKAMLFPNFTEAFINYPSASRTGFETVLDVIAPTGLLTVVPAIATVFVWFFFSLKILGLYGFGVAIRFGGGSSSEKGD